MKGWIDLTHSCSSDMLSSLLLRTGKHGVWLYMQGLLLSHPGENIILECSVLWWIVCQIQIWSLNPKSSVKMLFQANTLLGWFGNRKKLWSGNACYLGKSTGKIIINKRSILHFLPVEIWPLLSCSNGKIQSSISILTKTLNCSFIYYIYKNNYCINLLNC